MFGDLTFKHVARAGLSASAELLVRFYRARRIIKPVAKGSGTSI